MPSERQQSMRQTTEQHQEMGVQQLLDRHGSNWRSVLVNAVADEVKDAVEAVLCRTPVSELRSSPAGLEHVMHRLTREVIELIGNDLMDDIVGASATEAAAVMMDRINQGAASAASDVVEYWSDTARHYTPPDQSFARKQYDGFLAARSNAQPEARRHDHVPDLRDTADARFQAVKNGVYETVRGAAFRKGTPDDVPRIAASYRSALLNRELLQLLVRPPGATRDDVNKRIEQFSARMKKGVFIWDESIEPDGTRLPLEESLVRDLEGRTYREKGMATRLRMLESRPTKDAEGGKLLAWMTYLHNDRHADRATERKQRKTVRTYLRRGVTGRMMYDSESTPRSVFERKADDIQLFLDIRSHYPMAAKRLGALGYQEMFDDNDRLSYILAYRLHDLFIYPPLDLVPQTRENGVLPAWNDSSGTLFNQWGYRPIALDFNPNRETAPLAERADVGGEDRKLNPKWEVMVGKVESVAKTAREQWRAIQVGHGDVSDDVFSKF